jgi:Raf kinase inhibitor-like YbhB/YbcL family protein
MAAALLVAAALSVAPPALALDLASPDTANGVMLSLAQVHSLCGGGNISPALAWRGAPAGTESFAVTLFDPDAHGGWWHWVVYDIPADVHGLARGAGSSGGTPPAGTQTGRNDFGMASYGGACPPPGSGVHHYRFTVWALPVLDLPFGMAAKADAIGPYLSAHALASASLTPIYKR